MSRSDNLALLNDAVARYGQPPAMASFLSRIMQAESGGDAHAKNRKSSAKGIFQFIDSTWAHYGKGGNVYDPAAQCDAVVRLTMDNAKALRAVLGREPTAGEYYLAHFAGPSGARKVLEADPSTPLIDLLGGPAMTANAPIKFRGKAFADFTAGDLQAWTAARMGVDMDAREAYAQRRKANQTTPEEDEEELVVRRKNLESFGVETSTMDTIGMGLLGDFFFAMIKFFLEASAPPAERAAEPAASHDPQVKLAPTPAAARVAATSAALPPRG